ncbi:hypothetical protein KsCSTR_05580 [Candidatus Kuenenia stuttgartiensis]|uniref:Uncharacterized protein n=1 Tax=Kuenenia stuttgartiensis TaxID=174633 RepID=Q1Q026_KUEST|nr:hypothetical protein KsCSTR_05580 [Candidatus Kuenenia stuttgartiensis]CAJ72683.1 unknown protein [Candidatus Kuenenia stuttgartiensis]
MMLMSIEVFLAMDKKMKQNVFNIIQN